MRETENHIAYRRDEAAKLLHISVRTLDALIRERSLRSCRVGRKRVIIPAEAISEFLSGAGVVR
jgi:excisionase family DNA binding protein